MKSARVLIVDDDVAMLRTVTRILAQEYEVQSAASPKEALTVAKTFDPHLAILDIRMAGMDGFELMNALKTLNADVQVILMTGSIYDIDEQLIRAIREKAFYYITKPFDREVLRTLVHRCLELQFLEDANRRHVAHLEGQLSEARAFQETMLPAKSAQIEGFEIHAAHQPCTELAGDLYDYASVGAGQVALLIADVVGHGVSAAMLTGIVKSAFNASHVDDYAPLSVVRRISEGIAAFEADRFVTVLSARISGPEGRLEYVNAGHEGGVMVGPSGELTPLASTGPLISPALPFVTWDQNVAQWRSGSQVLLYTDGIAEAPKADDKNDLFGVKRVHAVVQNHTDGCEALLGAILDQVTLFTGGRPSDDDITLLTARSV